jgi:hypothetical protein
MPAHRGGAPPHRRRRRGRARRHDRDVAPGTDVGGTDGPDGRGIRYLEWSHPPAPGSTAYDVDFVVVLRGADGEREVVHDRHRCGLFPTATWLRLLDAEGFDASVHAGDPLDEDAPQDVLVGIRRA